MLASSLGTTHRMWEPNVAALATRHRVVRYDHPGHGESPPGPRARTDQAYDEPLVSPVSVKLRAEASSRTGVPPLRATSMPLTSPPEGSPHDTVAEWSPATAVTSVGAGAGGGTSRSVTAVTLPSIGTVTELPRTCWVGAAPSEGRWTVMSRVSGKE